MSIYIRIRVLICPMVITCAIFARRSTVPVTTARISIMARALVMRMLRVHWTNTRTVIMLATTRLLLCCMCKMRE